MPTWYTQLPSLIDLVAFSIGIFSVRWYAICYVGGFFLAYLLVRYRIRKKELLWSVDCLDAFFLWSFIGAVLGARVGYILLYDPTFFQHPMEALSPFYTDGSWRGISGLSFHGALVGVCIAGLIFAKKRKISFFALADGIVPAIGVGYMLGRLGNFLNHELFGRVTTHPFGMLVDGTLRWPSQFIEMILEGLVPFIILWIFRNKNWKQGTLLALYIMLYSLGRFFAEFFREPDVQLGFFFHFFTMGQILSVIFFLLAGIFLLIRSSRSFLPTLK